MILLGTGVGICFPALMTLAMSGATPERRRPGLRPGQHDRAGRRRARAGGARDAVGDAQRQPDRERRLHASALTSGYHLAFLVGAGLVAAAIVVAVTVLQPEERAVAQVEAEAEQADAEPAWSEAA